MTVAAQRRTPTMLHHTLRLGAMVWLLLMASGVANAVELTISATSPHLANGVDRSSVVVIVTDDAGQPVTNADIEIEVRPPHFATQLTHYVQRFEVFHRGAGQYAVTFASPLEGPFLVIATDRGSAAAAFTEVEFLGPPLLEPPEPEPESSEVGAVALADDCKKFFEALDQEFLPPVLARRIFDEPALAERLADMLRVGRLVQFELLRENAKAAGRPGVPPRPATPASEKPSFQRISDALEALLKRFFGDPIDFAKVQTCMELFNNFELVEDFDKAVARLRRLRELQMQLAAETDPAKRQALQEAINAIGRLVVNGPDGAEAHIRWAKFANIAIEYGISDTLWRNMKAITAKGSTITVMVLSDNDTTKDGIQPGKQSEEKKTEQRGIYEPLRPAPGDSDEEKKRKIEEIEKKVEDLLRRIQRGETLAQLPGLDGGSTLVATITPGTCLVGSMIVTGPLTSAVTINQTGSELFGFGSDNAGRTYVARGTVDGSSANFMIEGWGFNPGLSSALTTYTGVVAGDTITGTLEGFGTGSFGGPEDTCDWTGTFVLAPRLLADMDGDGDVDRLDMSFIFAARNIPARPNDPREVQSDQTINVNDVRAASLRCTRPLCAPQ